MTHGLKVVDTVETELWLVLRMLLDKTHNTASLTAHIKERCFLLNSSLLKGPQIMDWADQQEMLQSEISIYSFLLFLKVLMKKETSDTIASYFCCEWSPITGCSARTEHPEITSLYSEFFLTVPFLLFEQQHTGAEYLLRALPLEPEKIWQEGSSCHKAAASDNPAIEAKMKSSRSLTTAHLLLGRAHDHCSH